MKKGKAIIRRARSYCEVIDGLDAVIKEIKIFDKIKINDLTIKERKGKLILAILKEKIEDGANLSLNDDHTAFKKNY